MANIERFSSLSATTPTASAAGSGSAVDTGFGLLRSAGQTIRRLLSATAIDAAMDKDRLEIQRIPRLSYARLVRRLRRIDGFADGASRCWVVAGKYYSARVRNIENLIMEYCKITCIFRHPAVVRREMMKWTNALGGIFTALPVSAFFSPLGELVWVGLKFCVLAGSRFRADFAPMGWLFVLEVMEGYLGIEGRIVKHGVALAALFRGRGKTDLAERERCLEWRNIIFLFRWLISKRFTTR